jgi:hypothetical protein
MASEMYRKATQAAATITGSRWCGQCQMNRTVEGGVWKSLNGGQRRRWMCSSCIQRQVERREEKRALAAGMASHSTAG